MWCCVFQPANGCSAFAGQNHFFGAITGVSINTGRPPFYACFLVLFLIFPFFFLLVTEKDKKMKNLVFSPKQMISTSERHAEHPFDGQNTQQ